ncbi:Signal recognition particle subunit SRP72 [Entamoeba marina]
MEELKKLIQQNKKKKILVIFLNYLKNVCYIVILLKFEANPSNNDMFKIMIVSSIKSGIDVSQYDDKMKELSMTYERCLNMYNIEKYDTALQLLTGTEENDILLKAQILQKQKKYKEAADLYATILKTYKGPKGGILTNLSGCMVNDETIDIGLIGTKTSDFSSETYGNMAVVMLRKGELTKAESYFNKALGASVIGNVTTEDKTEMKYDEDEEKKRLRLKRKEKRQRKRQREMKKKYGDNNEKNIDPERWIPTHLRKKNLKKGKR